MIKWLKGYLILSTYARDISSQSCNTNLRTPCRTLPKGWVPSHPCISLKKWINETCETVVRQHRGTRRRQTKECLVWFLSEWPFSIRRWPRPSSVRLRQARSSSFLSWSSTWRRRIRFKLRDWLELEVISEKCDGNGTGRTRARQTALALAVRKGKT